MQNEDDFVGYERINDDFHPRFQPKSSQLTDTSVSKDCHVERDKQKVDVSWTSAADNSSIWKSYQQKHVKDSLLPETFASKVALPSWSAVIPPSQPSFQLNGKEGRNQESNKLSATTFQPVKSVFTPKPSVSSKKFLDKKNSSLKKKPSDESDSVCRKPRSDLPKRPPALAVEEHFDHGMLFINKLQ